ncbi:transcriptional regulator, GntR family [Sphingomonas sp. YR710]|uniref:aminotransferase-like domain-containing protein n=1 Tax=Sphingomonas sp. YR710 TaxID=1882773 RepID=UPI00088EAA26|nr:PLP-dependent aminotransferase family protein [Sphingomonas sp. YR710]SDD72659.1 transcriptional regulator, GntR family [Sphingomonas sp. YR710]
MWTPALLDDADTVTGRLVSALRRDIAEGRLSPGTKLPPHRELAHRLGIGIGTVTASYAEAARQGLLTAQVGRGSFVAEAAALPAGPILMGQNIPPLAPSARRFSATLTKLRNRADLTDQLTYAPAAGHDTHRRLGAIWLRQTSGMDAADPKRLIVTTGAQQAMTLAVDTLCRPGDTIVTEAATYFGIRSIAQAGGYKVRGLAMDQEGLLPDALERAAAQGARVLYTLPTLQNPTGRTMSAARRADIAGIARKYGLWIIEDDIYSAFALGNSPPPLSLHAPERSFYINGTSKALAPGLRTGYLLVPDADHLERVLRLIRARIYAPATMGAMIASQWIEDGSAAEIVSEMQAEMQQRGAIARRMLGDVMELPADPRCPHIWLPMPELAAERMAARALRAGVEVTPPSAPVVDPDLISGVRVCVGAIADHRQVESALRIIAMSMTSEVSDRVEAVV